MKWSTLTTGLALCLTMTCAAAQWKPTKQLEYVVPAAPGGAVDTYARTIRQMIEAAGATHGQSFIVSNRPGGDGLIALNPLVQSPGDAHLMTLLSTGFLVRQAQGDFKYDLTQDFTIGPILFEEVLGVAVRMDSPLQSAADLIEHLRRNPGGLRIAISTSFRNHIHVGILQPLHVAGIDTEKLTIAPFRSSAQSVTALYGNHVDVVSASVGNLAAGFRSGMLRILAVSANERMGGELSVIPTWREQGVDAVFPSIQGILFPRGLGQDQLQFWDEHFRTLSQSPQWQAILQQYEVTSRYMDHTQAKQFVQTLLDENKTLMRDLGLTQ